MKITQQSIIKHFNNPNAVGHGEWLLFKSANIKKLDVRIRRLHEALGTSHSYDEAAQAAVLKAIECWTKPRCLPFHGFLIPGTDLRVFRASKEEGYGQTMRSLWPLDDLALKRRLKRLTSEGEIEQSWPSSQLTRSGASPRFVMLILITATRKICLWSDGAKGRWGVRVQ